MGVVFMWWLFITKHSSALYIGMAKVLPIIDVLGYDRQNSSCKITISIVFYVYSAYKQLKHTCCRMSEDTTVN